MSENLPAKKIEFEDVLQAAVKLPGVRIDRSAFLEKELSKYFEDSLVQTAIMQNPARAGIGKKLIDKIAGSCIAYESTKVTALSAAAGIPGGLAMIGTIPADLAQYFGHILRILQKLAYLYGWQEFWGSDLDGDGLDDGLANQLTLFVGVMFGVGAANAAVAKIAQAAAANVPKQLMKKALAKGTIYPIVKKIAANIGVKMTKEVFAKSVGKIIPVVGAVVSGGLTIAGFLPMSKRLKKYLSGLPLADPEFFKREHNGEAVDLDLAGIDTEETEE